MLIDHGYRPRERSRTRVAVPQVGGENRVRGQGRRGQRRDGRMDPVGGRRGRRICGEHHGPAAGDGYARGSQTSNGPRGRVGQQRGCGREHIVHRPGSRRRHNGNSQYESTRSDLGKCACFTYYVNLYGIVDMAAAANVTCVSLLMNSYSRARMA